jgi:hypothetical protein
VPYQPIDVILWDDGVEIMASPVSRKGFDFTKGVLAVENTPHEFANHIPKGLGVIFLKDDGKIVPINANQGLQ